MKKWMKCLVSYGTAFLILLLGIVWHGFAPSTVAMIMMAVLAILPLFLLAANLIAAKQYTTRLNKTKVADMQSYMLRHRKEAQEASGKLLSKLQRIRRLTWVYTVFVWLLGACAAVLGGMLYSFTETSFLMYLCILYSGTVFWATYARIYKRKAPELDENAPVLKREDYPQLYAIADRAAKALDCRGEITILLTLDCNAGILRHRDRYYLQLGVVLLNILSEDELYCIFLHEFSHVADKNNDTEYEIKYGAWIGEGKEEPPFMKFVGNMFIFFDIYYLFHHMTYWYATSVVHETEADRDMLIHGNAKSAASALLKLSYDEKYQWESGVEDETPVYAAEKPNPNYLKEQIERFQKAIEVRHKDWDAMVDLEILPNNASHPILKMRLETLGVERAEPVEDTSSSLYRAEVQNALAFAEKRLYDAQDTYEKDRKEAYLDPLERVKAWEEQGRPVVAEGFGDVLSDLRQLCRHEEANALCDRAIAELDENSSPLAYFQKGCVLLYRYDAAGMDLLYHAIEKNANFVDEGLQIIGTFCCMTGREKELLEYRARAQQLAQRDVDEYRETGVLSKTDRLSAEHLPEGMLENILAFIMSVDEDIIKNVYLVRKTINENFFTSAFVIHFWGGTDAQRGEIMHKIFRYLDTYPVDWQFSLFDYADLSDIKFDKIEGSLVYTKNNNKGE